MSDAQHPGAEEGVAPKASPPRRAGPVLVVVMVGVLLLGGVVWFAASTGDDSTAARASTRERAGEGGVAATSSSTTTSTTRAPGPLTTVTLLIAPFAAPSDAVAAWLDAMAEEDYRTACALLSPTDLGMIDDDGAGPTCEESLAEEYPPSEYGDADQATIVNEENQGVVARVTFRLPGPGGGDRRVIVLKAADSWDVFLHGNTKEFDTPPTAPTRDEATGLLDQHDARSGLEWESPRVEETTGQVQGGESQLSGAEYRSYAYVFEGQSFAVKVWDFEATDDEVAEAELLLPEGTSVTDRSTDTTTTANGVEHTMVIVRGTFDDDGDGVERNVVGVLTLVNGHLVWVEGLSETREGVNEREFLRLANSLTFQED